MSNDLLTRYLDEPRALMIKLRCEEAGWKDLHGGPEEGGMYWRGVSPHTGRVEEIPKEVYELSNKNETTI
jgi:hypothetical protein